VRNVKTRQNERIFGERRTEIQPFPFYSFHKTQYIFENCLFFYNQTATENITKFLPKKYLNIGYPISYVTRKFWITPFCTRQFLNFFFWKFTNTRPIDLARCQLFAIDCPHDELFKPASRRTSEYFCHFVSPREFYNLYHATWQSWRWLSGNSALKCRTRAHRSTQLKEKYYNGLNNIFAPLPDGLMVFYINIFKSCFYKTWRCQLVIIEGYFF
jgi:hypothetical protein